MSRAAKWFYLLCYWLLRVGCFLGWHDWAQTTPGRDSCLTCGKPRGIGE